MAKLGKDVKGKSAKKGKGAGDSKEAELLAKARSMEEADYERQVSAAQRKALKAQLDKERAMTKINAKKVNNGWLKIMRLAAVDSLRRDVEIISQNHERDVDRRDALLQMLDRDIDEAEEQFQMALRAHLQNLDQLISLQDTRLVAAEQEFEHELQVLEDEFAKERSAVVAQHNQERKELNDLIDAVASQEAYKAAESKQEFDQLVEEVRNRHLEEINLLSAGLDAQIDELERHFESAHLNYLQNTDKRTMEFKDLTREDKLAAGQIESRIRQIERLQNKIALWKTKVVQNAKEFTEKNAALTEEKAAMAKHVTALKAQMRDSGKLQARRLKDLAAAAAEAKSELEISLSLAERLLQLSEQCRKLETHAERVLPWTQQEAEATDEERMHDPELEKLAAAMRAQELDQIEIDESQLAMLDKFFARYNQALLSQLALEREKQRLEDDNAQLQAVLKQFLEGISVSPEVMVAPNTLLVVNGRTNAVPPVRPVMASPAVIEGNHMVATGRIAARPLGY